jgi:hypothetical protein
MIYDEKDQMEKDRNLWKFRLRVKSHVIPCSSISVADAIRAASKLKADLKFSEIEASFVDVLICRKIRFFMMLRRYYGQKLSHLDCVRSTNTKCMKGFN